jgi:HK97 family phage prohead protease
MKRPGLEIVRRTYPLLDVSVRQAKDDEPSKISGHAAVFNKLSEPLGGFRERVRPGAFAKTIREGDARALWNHNSDLVLGRVGSKTLSLREDSKGLFFEAIPPDTTWARDMMVSLERGDVDQASFGFRAVREEWMNTNDDSKDTIRELIEVELFDVSPVTFPAYPQTDAQARAILDGAGLQLDELAGALERALERPDEVTDEDRQIIKRAIDTLSSTLPGAPEGIHPPGERGPDEGSVSLDQVRRRLELIG